MENKIGQFKNQAEGEQWMEVYKMSLGLVSELGQDGPTKTADKYILHLRERDAPPVPKKWDLSLLSVGPDKVRTIKALRQINPSLSLKDAKEIVDTVESGVGVTIKEIVDDCERQRAEGKIKSVGASIGWWPAGWLKANAETNQEVGESSIKG